MSITLGEFIAELEKRPQDQSIQYDFGGLIPTHVGSWRGVYAHLALGWEDYYQRQKRKPKLEHPTVGEIVAILKAAIGETFTGWKGGEFVMDIHTPVWCDNAGTSTSTGVVGVHPLSDYSTIIQTKYEEYSG
jgi:hypothetical protein